MNNNVIALKNAFEAVGIKVNTGKQVFATGEQGDVLYVGTAPHDSYTAEDLSAMGCTADDIPIFTMGFRADGSIESMESNLSTSRIMIFNTPKE